MPNTFFILAGEASGDHHGAKLIRELKAREEGLRVVGMGGPKMAAAGLEVAKDLEGMSVVGFWEVAKHYGFFRTVFYELLDRVRQERPAALICIDYPGFNLRFAREVRKLGIPVLYYIVPQVWAWKEKRAKAMTEFVDKAFCVFDFEIPFFERYGLKTEFVGHPLMDDGGDYDARIAASGLAAPEGVRSIAYLPGSRGNEIRALAAPLAQSFHAGGFAAKNCRALMSFPKGTSFCEITDANARMAAGKKWAEAAGVASRRDCSVVSETSSVLLNSITINEQRFLPLDGPHSALLPRMADFSVVKSGTSTLEAGLSGNPLCVVYKASAVSFAIAHLLVNIPVFSLVNIVLGKYAVPELLQGDVNPRRLAEETQRGLFDEKYREQQRKDLAELPKKLGGPGASARAAQRILDFVKGKA